MFTAASTGTKSYILVSTLHETLIGLAAQTDEELYEEECADLPSDDESDVSETGDDDEERPPRSFGSIISWSHTEQVGALGILYVALAIILVNGRALPESKCVKETLADLLLTIVQTSLGRV